MRITPEKLATIRATHRNETIAYTSGCFDLLHRGHLELLRRVKKMGRIAVVGVTPDEKIRLKKGPNRPVHDEETRVEVINALRYVDYAFVAPLAIPGYRFVGEGVLRVLRPDFLVTGDDAWRQDEKWLREQGTELVMDERPTGGPSTTATVEKILSTGHGLSAPK